MFLRSPVRVTSCVFPAMRRSVPVALAILTCVAFVAHAQNEVDPGVDSTEVGAAPAGVPVTSPVTSDAVAPTAPAVVTSASLDTNEVMPDDVPSGQADTSDTE